MIDSLTEVRTFVRVVEAAGFTAAARSLGVSTALVSRQVAALEARLGVRLLSRNTRRVAPTEAGRQFHQRCVSLLQDLDEAQAELGRFGHEVRGTLKVSLPPELATSYLAPLLTAFQSRHPQLVLHLFLSNQLSRLVEEGLDAAIRFMRHHDSTLNGRQLARTRMVLVASPDYVLRVPPPEHPADLLRHRALVYGAPDPWTEFPWVTEGGEQGVMRLQPGFIASSTDMIGRAAVLGQGVALMTTMDAGAALREGKLVQLLPQYDFGHMGVFVVYPHRRHVPARLRAWIDFLLEIFGADPEHDPFITGLPSTIVQPTRGVT